MRTRRPARARSARAFASVIEQMEPRTLLTTFTVTTVADAGAGSLRQAIHDANSNAGADAIHFNIAGADKVIAVGQVELPTITEQVTLDATTQPGYAGRPLIELRGPSRSATSDWGISAFANGTIIRGFAIHGFWRGIYFDGTVKVEGNYIGTDLSGTAGLGNLNGIVGTGGTIGGTTVAARNVISNNNNGMVIYGGNTVQGNWIGLNPEGTAAVPNNAGILLNGGTDFIGGSLAAARNVISGNGLAGIALGTGSTGFVVITGNYIGTNPRGTAAIGNGVGIRLNGVTGGTIGGQLGGSSRNVISGNVKEGLTIEGNPDSPNGMLHVFRNYVGLGADGESPVANGEGGVRVGGAINVLLYDNSIAHNGAAGLIIPATSATYLDSQRNQIFGNVGLGIEGLAAGPTANDAGDADTLSNHPTLTAAVATLGGWRVTGQIASARPNTQYEVELYASAVSDAGGAGEGEDALRTTFVTTDATGNATFQLDVSPTIALGVFSATARRSDGGISEFSPNLEFAGDNVAPTIASLSDSPDPGPVGGSVTLVANNVADANGNVRGVRFWREANGFPGPQTGPGDDDYVAEDLTPADGFTATASTSLPPGTYTYYVQPFDSRGLLGNIVSTTHTVASGSAISGIVFNDLNGDGTLGGDEPRLNDRRVFVDGNGNDAYDPGEPTALTDDLGRYAIFPLAAGTYAVGVVEPAGWEQTGPAGTRPVTVATDQNVTAVHFGQRPASDHPVDIVIDNAQATLTGAWLTSSSVAGFYGSNFAQDGGTNKGQLSATYAPQLPAAGTYDVYAWWPAKSNRSTRVPYAVAHAGGTSTVFVNQRVNGGQWNKLGSYAFAAGTGGSVVIRNAGTSGYVAADAVRFVKAGTTPPPAERQEVVLDNSSAGVTRVGTWTASTYDKGFLGANYLHDGNAGKGARSVSYKAALAGGTYAVYARWTSSGNKASNVPVDVRHAGGTARVTVNQRLNGGAWVLLGQYAFDADGTVTVSNAGTNGFVVADGVKFVPVG